jgi:hypothetical protein
MDQRKEKRVWIKLCANLGTCQRVLTKELGTHRVAAKFVPRTLTAEIQSESKRVLDFQEAFKQGGDGGTGVYSYLREETISRVLAANRSYGEFYDFYSVSPEYFGYHLVSCILLFTHLLLMRILSGSFKVLSCRSM